MSFISLWVENGLLYQESVLFFIFWVIQKMANENMKKYQDNC